jgi:tRNA synthetases class I (R)
VQKTDGGYMYSTTDLAAIRHRATVERADRVLYVTDAGQSFHFDQVFQVARRGGFAPPALRLQHVPFGLVQVRTECDSNSSVSPERCYFWYHWMIFGQKFHYTTTTQVVVGSALRLQHGPLDWYR